MTDAQPGYRDRPLAPQAALRAAGMLPSCPHCGAHNTRGGPEASQPISRQPRGAVLAERFPFLCGPCGGIFAGSDEEWRTNRERRERVASQRKPRGAPSRDAGHPGD